MSDLSHFIDIQLVAGVARKSPTLRGCRRSASIVWAVAVLSACAGNIPRALEAPAEDSPPTRLPIALPASTAAESFSFDVEVGFVRLAKALVHFDPVTSSRARIHVKAETSGTGRFLRHTEVDGVSVVGLPIPTSVSSEHVITDQGKVRSISTYFRATDGETNVATRFPRGNGSGLISSTSIAELSPLSGETFLIALRAWRPTRGQQAVAVVASGPRLWFVRLVAQPPKMVSSKLGTMRAQQLAGKAIALRRDGSLGNKTRRLSFILSDDERRLPLRIEAQSGLGNIKVELTRHHKF